MIDIHKRIASLSDGKRALLALRLDKVVPAASALNGKGEVRQLVGYVVAGEGHAPSAVELRGRLSEKLPEYMIPSTFVMLDSLPLTQNGKIDRRALPAPEDETGDLEEGLGVPRTPVEEVLAGIWADVLKLDYVGTHDNFFALGGHSLLATRVISRTREALQVEVPIQSLFEAPTVAGLAAIVERATSTGRDFHALPIERVARDGELPLSYAQQGLWVVNQLEPDTPLYNIAASIRLEGRLDVPALNATLNEIVRRHETLRTVFPSVGGRPAQVILPASIIELPFKDLRTLPRQEREAEAMRLATEDARRPFNLSDGPLLRATLLKLDDEDHALLFTMHHIISDGWSTGVLIEEVMALYEMFSGGRYTPLPELPIQYADYAHWQRQWLKGEVLEAQVSYWKEQLAGANPSLDLPAARPRPAVQTFNGATQLWTLPVAQTERLKALSRQEGVTLFMTLLAAFQTLLYRYSGQDDITIGSPVANRNRREVERIIGYFINVLALRTDLSGNPSFKELLKRVRQVALSAYAHQDLPFERLVGELQLERDPSRSPLFQAVLVLQNAPVSELKLPGLTLSPLASDRGTTHVDLYFSIAETEEGLSGLLKYNTDLYDGGTIRQMLRHFELLLNDVVSHPDSRLLSISLPSAEKDTDAPPAPAPQHKYSDDQFAF